MRIDDLSRSQQADVAKRPDQSGERSKTELTPNESPDHADISHVADSLRATDPQRLEQLRLAVQKGTYKVSAEAVAKSIIDEHLKR